MRIGFAVDVHGQAPPSTDTTDWQQIRAQAQHAERLGFDLVVVADHLLFPSEDGSTGGWESVSLLGALAAATSTIELGHSMLNAPYRPPTMVAKIAETLDEISGGRYILGIGAGNTPDYAAVGVEADHRCSRLAEALEIIRGLLRDGAVDFRGSYWSAEKAELVLRGPRVQGPPIVLAAWGPRMMRLAARFADAWNGWTPRGPDRDKLLGMIRELERACEEVGRDPRSVRRTLDVQVDPLGLMDSPDWSPLAGEPSAIAAEILSYREWDVDEVRCYLACEENADDRTRALDAMAEVVELVHAA